MTIWNSTCNPCFSTFDQIFFVFHGLKTGFFCYSLKINFICYPNRFFTYDYSLWDGGDIRFCGQKQTLIIYKFTQGNLSPKKNCQKPISVASQEKKSQIATLATDSTIPAL